MLGFYNVGIFCAKFHCIRKSFTHKYIYIYIYIYILCRVLLHMRLKGHRMKSRMVVLRISIKPKTLCPRFAWSKPNLIIFANHLGESTTFKNLLGREFCENSQLIWSSDAISIQLTLLYISIYPWKKYIPIEKWETYPFSLGYLLKLGAGNYWSISKIFKRL